MDTALILKIKISKDSIRSFEEARPLLEQSILFQKLLSPLEPTSLHLLHRLIELSEIPYAQEFKQVQRWRDQLADQTFCGEGFSLTGKKEDLLACYNAMITNTLIQLDYANSSQISKGIDWILNYQNTQRNQINQWKEKGIQKYGGCMKATPCFIGVVKSMICLTTFQQKNKFKHQQLSHKLENGLEYILDHKLYQRKSIHQPITKDITKLSYPFTYKTNILEILRLLQNNHLLKDPRTQQAKALLLKKQKKNGFWKANAVYKPKYWIDFDTSKEKATWLTYEIKKVIQPPFVPVP